MNLISMNNFELFNSFITSEFENSSKVLQLSKDCSNDITKAAILCIDCLKNGNKILICGNGGSAADSQHIAAELINRYRINRKPFAAISLTTDTSNITSIGNDFDFNEIFSKQVEALAKPKDVLIGLSTSGNSKNIVNAFLVAKKSGVFTISLTGSSGGALKSLSDVCIKIPSTDTPRIQEAHHVAYHCICDLIEQSIKM